MTEDWQAGGFGLYIHWPFCAAKCPYCDFNSHVARDIDQARWKNAYLSEIGRLGSMVPGRVLNSVFFGGGTPSLMAPEVVDAILSEVRRTWPAANDLEVTLEANPGSVEADRFSGYAQAGVSRLSMGIQALNDADLRRLGRIHDVAEARRAFDIARDRFRQVSFDLIYARQGQSLAAWRAELTQALAMAVDHLSLYQLTIEPGTAFGARHAAGGLRDLPSEDMAADMYALTQEVCAAAGLPAYEVSNHARPGAECRHNLIYWRHGDYAGIGPGAHGRLTLQAGRHATEAWHSPERWLRGVETGDPEKVFAAISPEDQAAEYLMMGLRIDEGIDVVRYARLAGMPLNESALAHLQDIGMVLLETGRLRTTPRGRPLLNAVLRDLLLG